jgi:hypothetical protein
MKSNHIALDLPPDQALWVDDNQNAVAQLVARAAATAVANESERRKRRDSLLIPEIRAFYPEIARFALTDFPTSGLEVNRFEGLFAEEFLGVLETDIAGVEIVASKILEGGLEVPYATDREVRERIGGSRIELKLAHICRFLETADTSHWYAFYAKGKKGIFRLITANWYKGWFLCAVPVGYSDEWRNGGYVVSQDFE